MGASGRIQFPQADAWKQSSHTIAAMGKWPGCCADRVALTLLAETSPCLQRGELSDAAFTGVVAKLKIGASIEDANQELQKTSGLRARSLSGLRKASLIPVAIGLLLLMLLSVISVRATTIRVWLWAMPKITLCFALIASIWIGSAARAPITETGAIDGAWSLLLHTTPLFAG